MLWLRYYERQTMATVVRGLQVAFGFSGDVPSELLFDQMPAWNRRGACEASETVRPSDHLERAAESR